MFHWFMKERNHSNVTFVSIAVLKKRNMNVHVASAHEGKKPFKCAICGYRCSRNSNLKRHVASVHEENKPFKCDICDYSCSRKGKLKQHVASVHEGKNGSNVLFVTTCSLKQHVVKKHEGKQPLLHDVLSKLFYTFCSLHEFIMSKI